MVHGYFFSLNSYFFIFRRPGVSSESRVMGRGSRVSWESGASRESCGSVEGWGQEARTLPLLSLSIIHSVSVVFCFPLFFALVLFMIFLMKFFVKSKIWRFSLKFNKSSGTCTRKNTILQKTIQISMVKMTKIVEKNHWFCLTGWEGGGAKGRCEMSSITCSSYLLVYFGDDMYTRWCSSSGDVVINAEKPVTDFCLLALPW